MYIKNIHTSCDLDGCDSDCDIESSGYRHYPTQESSDGVMRTGESSGSSDGRVQTETLTAFIAACDSVPNYPAHACKGFSSEGYIKNSLKSVGLWNPFQVTRGSVGCPGMWIKTSYVDSCIGGGCDCAIPDGYTYYPYAKPGYSGGGTSGLRNTQNTNDAASLASACDATGSASSSTLCYAFSSLESSLVKAVDARNAWTIDAAAEECAGLYTRDENCAIGGSSNCGYCGGGSRRSRYCVSSNHCCDSSAKCCSLACENPVLSSSCKKCSYSLNPFSLDLGTYEPSFGATC